MGLNRSTGIVIIGGKEYSTVAKRVQDFHDTKTGCYINTEIVHRDEECVVMKASIINPEGKILATGHAEEYRASSQLNKSSALENCETSAIGRALACFGFGGTEFASADEVANAIHQQKSGVHKPTDGAAERVSPERKSVVNATLNQVVDFLSADRDFDAYALCETLTDPDEKVALWAQLDSKQRRRLKEAKTLDHGTQP